MNLKTTLALIVVLAAVAVATYVLTGQGSGPPPIEDESAPAAERPALLPDTLIDLNRLSLIELELPEQTVTIDRTDAGWAMQRPRRLPVNPTAIQEIKTILESLKAVPRATDEPPSDYVGAVHLVTDTTTVSLTLGPTLGGGLSHIMLEHDGKTTQFTADAALYNVITQMEPTALLPSRLDTPSALRTQQVDIDSASGSVTLRKVDGRWYLGETGTGERALSTFLEGFTSVPGYLNIPAAAQIIRYQPLTDANLAAYGLDRPRVTLTYTRPGDSVSPVDTRAELRVGSPATPDRKAYYVSYRDSMQDEPVIAVMPWDFSAVLEQPADAFRDPRVMETEPGLVKAVRGDGFGQDFVAGFQTAEPDDLEDESALQRALRSLAAARASGYVAVEELDGEPLATLTIEPRLTDRSENLTVYADTAAPSSEDASDSLLVVRNDETIALRVPAAVIRDFFQ